MPDYLLRIVVNEQQHKKREQTCRAILSYLWDKGAPGATMFRGDAGIDDQGIIDYDVLEDSYFNNLPIIIESILEKSIVETLKEGINSLINHGQMIMSKGIEEDDQKEHQYFVIKVYTSENNKKLLKKEEYEKILQFLQTKKVIWATVTKGIAGYGRDHVIYSQHLFPLSEHLPIIIECVVDKDHLSDLIEELKGIVKDGVIFTMPAELLLNR